MYTQGLGKPRMTVEERIFDMMAQLDEHSEKIPEGMYLQFCDHLKVFHQYYENGVLRRKVRGRRGENQWRGNMFIDDDLGEEQRDEEQEELVAMFARPRGPRKCGCCREIGHDRRNCPRVPLEFPRGVV